jgi:branched-chain amino acid transport system substrate-binding protein
MKLKPFLRTAALSAALFTLASQLASAQIIVGRTVSETGPLASLDGAPRQGIKAAFSEVNAQGGIRGQKLELVELDDGGAQDKAAENVAALAGKGAVAVIMPIGTAASLGAIKAANAANIPVIGPYSGATPVMAFTPWSFPTRISFDDEFRRIVDHLFTLNITEIAFAHNDNPGAKSAMEGASRHIASKGKKLIGSVAIKQDASDAEQKAAELATMKPQVILLATTNPVAAKLIKAYRALGQQSQFYSFSFLDGRGLFKELGAQAAGTVISQVVPNPAQGLVLPIVGQYQKAMRASGQTQFNHASLEGYIAARTLIEALRRSKEKPSAEAIKNSLNRFDKLSLGGYSLSYNPQVHLGSRFSDLTYLTSTGDYRR